MKQLSSIDLFAGIGGIRLGFEQAFGNSINTVFVSEWDDNAKKTYRENFPDDKEISGDITKINESDIPPFDICLAGFPCQAFSLAGQKKGFTDDYKGMSRGTLFFDVVRICTLHKPKVIFCENVKGLAIHDKGRTYEIIKGTLEELGYKVFEKILNSKDFGVPQNRERIYIVAFRNDIDSSSFEFPKATDSDKRIKDIIEKDPVSVKYYLSEVYVETLKKHKARHESKGNGFGYEIRSWDGVAGAIVCGGMGRERNLLIDKRQTNLTPVTHIKGKVNTEGIRKMTPREWARLQGYDDSFVLPVADVHLYKQLGNSVSVPVIKAIAENVFKVLSTHESRDDQEMTITGNRGEWSEIYAFLRLLAEGKLYAADEKTNRLEGMFFPILNIFREDIEGQKYRYATHDVQIKIYLNDNEMFSKPISALSRAADELLCSIQSIRSKDRAFAAEGSQAFINDLGITKLTTSSTKKADIEMEIHDVYTGINRDVGFSIKSDLGSPPHLLNASKATNFVYEVAGLTASDIAEINAINTREKIIDRMKEISIRGGTLNFVNVGNPVFDENLALIDSQMPTIINEMLKGHYFHGLSKCVDLVQHVAAADPLGRSGTFYAHKIKDFLCAAALGLRPSKPWDGRDEANGGYVIVKVDGDVVAYHIYNRDFFKDYLLDRTKFERGSTTKHDFASIYPDCSTGNSHINLNLAIRFT